MNIAAAGQIGIYLLWNGGKDAVIDGGKLMTAYTLIKSGSPVEKVATPDVVSAFSRVLTILVGMAADPGGRATLTSFVNSFA